MSSTEAATALLERLGLVEQAKRAFFRSFFRLLLGFIALAEWACLAWVLVVAGLRPPLLAHVLAPLAIFALNRAIVVRRAAGRRHRQRLVDGLLRVYVPIAFSCIFCALFLAGAGLVWGAVALLPAAPRVARAYYWLVNAGFGTVGGLLFWGYTFGRRELTVSRLDVHVRGLPPALDGFRIVHVTDLHIGQHLDLAELAAHVGRVNALDPDLVCVTGDLVDRPETCAEAFPTLAGLRARHGVLVTLGNHDFYAGAETVTAALRRLTPFRVLRNERADVRVGGTTLSVLGIDDLGRDWARGVLEHPALPPLAAAVPDGRPFIVLSHRPDCFPQAARLGVALMLSGHTHGGQLALPGRLGRRARNLAEFISEFDRGLYRRRGATLYVNRGLGFTGQRIRLFTPREIACLELRAR
jgi:predicted MPP superfamily phosphohydrolase